MPATEGTKIELTKWRKTNRLATEELTRGQIGCYESHVRVWQQIVDERLSSALVLEDDADIQYSQSTVDRLREMLRELKTVGSWDVVYIGNLGLHPIKQLITAHLNEPSNWEGLYTYYITQAAAKKLLKNVFPIRMPIDIYVGDQMHQGLIRTLMMSPALNFVVPVQSDTNVKS